MAKKSGQTIGGWAFLLGVLLAVLFAFISFDGMEWILVLLGLIVGLLNITHSEVQRFLMAGTVLVIVGAFGSEGLSHLMYLSTIFSNLVALFAAATIIVALKSVFELARR